MSITSRCIAPARESLLAPEEVHATMHEHVRMYLEAPPYRSIQQRQNGCPAGSA